jgi:hypothetical protein
MGADIGKGRESFFRLSLSLALSLSTSVSAVALLSPSSSFPFTIVGKARPRSIARVYSTNKTRRNFISNTCGPNDPEKRRKKMVKKVRDLFV